MAAILKIENLLYLQKGSTDVRKIWHYDEYWASELGRKLKFLTFKNPRRRTALFWKLENRP